MWASHLTQTTKNSAQCLRGVLNMDKLHLVILFIGCIIVMHVMTGCASVDTINATVGNNRYTIGPVPLFKYEF
jgi:hypothetical protein